MKSFHAFSIVVALCLIACTKTSSDVLSDQPRSVEVRLNAQLPDIEISSPESRASLACVLRLRWHEGDAVSVVNLTTGKTLGGNLVSDSESASTTFSGTLIGAVSPADQLLFIYPCQNYTSESTFTGFSALNGFATQNGKSSSVPFVATAEGSLSEISVSNKPLDFVFGMSFFQINMANLPEDEEISSVILRGFNNGAQYSRSGSSLQSEYSEGDIVLTPSNLSTSAEGCRTMCFTCLPQGSAERSVTVNVGGTRYVSAIPSSQIAVNTSYNLNVSDFEEREPVTVTYEVTTNYGTYGSNSLDRAYDGNESTFFWSNGAQSSGKYILITFSSEVVLNSFATYSSNATDYPKPINKLQVSSDGSSWTDVGAFSDGARSTFSDIGMACRYARIYCSGSSNNWLVLNEITMEYEAL